MAAARRIDCIRQHDSGKSARITHVGGTNVDGTPWEMSEKETIREIEAGTMKFYCDVLGQSYLVVVSTDRSGAKYLKTAIDADSPDCLLRLSRCR